MSQLSEFVKKRSINNVVVGTVVSLPTNPMLVNVRLGDQKTVTLALAAPLALTPGDVVEVIRPQGSSRVEYVNGSAAVMIGGDPINRVIGPGNG